MLLIYLKVVFITLVSLASSFRITRVGEEVKLFLFQFVNNNHIIIVFLKFGCHLF